MENRFDEKVALVIGATGGIGSEICKRLNAEGAKLSLFSRNESKLIELQNEFKDTITVVGNATDFEDLKSAVNKTVNEFGKIDILIHTVGSIVLESISALSEEMFRNTLELNLISPFLAIKSVISKMMSQKNGSVVVISSVAGRKGLLNHEAISAAKGGLESMIKSAAITYAKRGIRFNGVALGLVDTPLADFLIQNEMSLKASEQLHPMGRIGKPRDVAEAVLYLASDDSSWTTGTIIPIDGGMSAK